MSATQRQRISALIDALIDLLDAAEPDVDLEPETLEDADNGVADLDALLHIERSWLAAQSQRSA